MFGRTHYWNFLNLEEFFFFFATLWGMWDLRSPPGMEPVPSAEEA